MRVFKVRRAAKTVSLLIKIKSMNVHQLSIAYVPEQDRILARVNTTEGRELQCWFTRRVALGVAPLIDKLVTEQVARRGGLSPAHLAGMDDLARKAVAQFQKTEVLKGADFATPYKAAEVSLPLFDPPLLVTEVNMATLTNGQLKLAFTEKLPGKPASRNFQMALSDQLVQAFVHLLERAILQSRWREAPGADPALAPSPEPSADSAKTGYLN